MFKKKDATRLGEILVSKGLITTEQLAIATHEQTKRNRLLNVADAKASKGVMIGEILVELGFIDQLELKRGLNWQQRLRHVSIAMALCAPFMVFVPSSASAQTSSTSSSSTSTSSVSFNPLTIRATSYSAMSGIQSETTSDTGGGQNIGYIDTGDWMAYDKAKFEVPATGTYKITFRVSSASGGGVLTLKESSNDITLDSFSVPRTGGWQTWVDVVRTVALTKGSHTFKIYATTGGFNVNWFKVEPTPTPMPLIIQAANYASMAGVQTEATTDTGGGKNVGYIDAQDWMSFTNVDVIIPTTASYKVTYRVASYPGGGSFTLGEANQDIVYDTISVPKTSGWQNWVSVEKTITLPAGRHNFAVKALIGGFNLNWIKFEPASSASSSSQSMAMLNQTSSSPLGGAAATTSSSSSSSSKATSSSPSSVSSSTGAPLPMLKNLIVSLKGPVGLKWKAPIQRENGNNLDITEVGGYELRYKLATAANFTYVTINDGWTNQYNFSWLEGDYILQIAAFDKNGIYSNFVNITPI